MIQAVASMDLFPFYLDYREKDWRAAAFEPGEYSGLK